MQKRIVFLVVAFTLYVSSYAQLPPTVIQAGLNLGTQGRAIRPTHPAGANAIQGQAVSGPPQGPCTHTKGKVGCDSYYPQDSGKTPGAIDPTATKAKVCVPNYTKQPGVRPDAKTYTNPLKVRQMKDLGLPGVPEDYEEDHFISLELGGHNKDPHNLWPEPWCPGGLGPRTKSCFGGANEKDQVENELHRLMCKAGTITIGEAQCQISTDWFSFYQKMKSGAALTVDPACAGK